MNVVEKETCLSIQFMALPALIECFSGRLAHSSKTFLIKSYVSFLFYCRLYIHSVEYEYEYDNCNSKPPLFFTVNPYGQVDEIVFDEMGQCHSIYLCALYWLDGFHEVFFYFQFVVKLVRIAKGFSAKD